MRGLVAAVGRANRGCSHCSRGNPSACIAKCSLSCVWEGESAGESEREHPACVVGRGVGEGDEMTKAHSPHLSPEDSLCSQAVQAWHTKGPSLDCLIRRVAQSLLVLGVRHRVHAHAKAFGNLRQCLHIGNVAVILPVRPACTTQHSTGGLGWR